MKFKILFASTILFGSTQFVAAMPVDPLLGSWKVIDDKTGHYISEVAIRKNSKTQLYSASITKSYALPGTVASEVCNKCSKKAYCQTLSPLPAGITDPNNCTNFFQ